jgi:hypothetical protein
MKIKTSFPRAWQHMRYLRKIKLGHPGEIGFAIHRASRFTQNYTHLKAGINPTTTNKASRNR